MWVHCPLFCKALRMSIYHPRDSGSALYVFPVPMCSGECSAYLTTTPTLCRVFRISVQVLWVSRVLRMPVLCHWVLQNAKDICLVPLGSAMFRMSVQCSYVLKSTQDVYPVPHCLQCSQDVF